MADQERKLRDPAGANAAYYSYLDRMRQQSDGGTPAVSSGVKPFQYDFNGDALYQAAAQRYQQMGRQAMMDTMGQAQTMTGGYGNSYAQNVGQQAYQGYLQGLNDQLPQFQQMAMDKYKMDYSQYQDNQKLAQGQVDYLMSIGVQPDEELLAMAGYSKQYVDSIVKPKTAGGGGGGSAGASDGNDGGDSDLSAYKGVLSLGSGPISFDKLASLVASGEAIATPNKDGTVNITRGTAAAAGAGNGSNDRKNLLYTPAIQNTYSDYDYMDWIKRGGK